MTDYDQLEADIFNETRLYEALGKEDARTVLAIFEQAKAAYGADMEACARTLRQAAIDAQYVRKSSVAQHQLARGVQRLAEACGTIAFEWKKL